MTNIRTHTPADAPVRVELGRSDEGEVRLRVCDEGPGMSDEDADRGRVPSPPPRCSSSSGTAGGILGGRSPEATPPKAAQEPPKEAGTFGATVVYGFVRTEEGAPVADAVLTLVSPGGEQLDRVATLADGAYILSAPAGGSYLLAVVSREYEPRTRYVVVGGEPLIHDLVLSPSEAASPSHPA